MPKTAQKIIKIKPKSKRNRLFLLCLGCLLLLGCLVLNQLFWHEYKIQLTLTMFASFMVLLLAIVKYLEPEISYFITPERIVYQHRNGQWRLPWQDIIRIGDINVDVFGEYKQLPYLGIRLNNLESIAQSISPRLANKLIHEQQDLLLLAIKNHEINIEDGVINFEPFHLNGSTYKGPVAAWLYRTEQLATAYGYHLYLPENSFDRDLLDFLSLLKKCQNYIKEQT